MSTTVVTTTSATPSWKVAESVKLDSKVEISPHDIPFSSLPYWLSYLVPLFIGLGFVWGSGWHYSGLVIAYVIVPVLDLVLPRDEVNPTKEQERVMDKMWRFSVVTWVWPPIQLLTVVASCWFVATQPVSLADWIGCAIGCGILGALGINCAHELLHKRNPYERFLAQLSLLCSAYLHFMIEHTVGHHNKVATPEDPATSRYGESFYQFWPRTVSGGFKSAWHLETERLHKAGLPIWSYHNNMISYTLSPVLLTVSIFYFLGFSAALFYVIQAIIGFSHLEAVNYIEHYGLVRAKLGEGLYEIVTPLHSWNAPYSVTNYFLFKLQRHSDHHAWPTRRYQILRSFPESPMLPTGYAGMVLLALVPPLFFRVMNPLADKVRAQYNMELANAKKSQ